MILKVLDISGVTYPDNVIEILTPLGDAKSAVYMRENLGVKFSEDEIKNLIAKLYISAPTMYLTAQEKLPEPPTTKTICL